MLLVRRFLASLFVVSIIGLGVAATVVSEARAEVYAVHGIEVDQTADTATAARQQAIAEAHRKAFRALIEKLVPAGEQSFVTTPEQGILEQYVRDFEVSEEQSSSVRYIAQLSFRFHGPAIRQYLRNAGVRFAVSESPPQLLLPVFGRGADAVVWDEPNPWRRAWSRRPATAGLVPLVIPLGDLSDMSAISAQQATAGEPGALAAITDVHNVSGAIVSQAALRGDPEAGGARVEITTTWYDVTGGGQGQTITGAVQQRPQEDVGAMMQRAADMVASDLNTAWKNANLVSFNQESQISAIVPFNGMGGWLEIRRGLAKVTMIEETRVTAFTRAAALIDISFFGDVGQLQRILARERLTLEESGLAVAPWRLASIGIGGGGATIDPSPAGSDEIRDVEAAPGSGQVRREAE